MLETIHEYARAAGGKHRRRGDSRRHLEHFLALAEAVEPSLRGPEELFAHGRLEVEHDNLRAALRWAVLRRDAESALRLAGALHLFWDHRGHLTEARRCAEAALALGKVEDATTRVKALGLVSFFALLQGDCAAASARSTSSWRSRKGLRTPATTSSP
jgi:predicted ATPase